LSLTPGTPELLVTALPPFRVCLSPVVKKLITEASHIQAAANLPILLDSPEMPR
jgi:hypothetical protein